jgi:hypothetical protein
MPHEVATKKEGNFKLPSFFQNENIFKYLVSYIESETVSLFLPLALRRASIFLPFFELMRALNPCLLTLLRLDG